MRPLLVGDQYTRKDLHEIYSPNEVFAAGSGTWGISGIVRIPGTSADFVFLVTLDQRSSTHSFVEGITSDGVLTWQSQPSQKLAHPQIETFIAHDEAVNTIRLFLRKTSADPYTYFGPLGYLDHDRSRELPVYFSWQVLTWPATSAVDKAAIALLPADEQAPPPPPTNGGLTQVAPPPPPRTRQSNDASGGGLSKQPRLPGQDAQNAALGLAGELLVVSEEQRRLRAVGRPDLASQVLHVSVVVGDGAGYDIGSFEDDGRPRHMEVKTTRGPRSNAFLISPNEVRFSTDHPDSFVLCRVHEFRDSPDRAAFYELRGSIPHHFELTPTEFRARRKPSAGQ